MPPDRDDTKRYFECDFGIDYTLVARDEDHARALLIAYAMDYDDTLEHYGEPIFTEVPAGVAATRRCFDGKDDSTKPLTEFEMGAILSSEF